MCGIIVVWASTTRSRCKYVAAREWGSVQYASTGTESRTSDPHRVGPFPVPAALIQIGSTTDIGSVDSRPSSRRTIARCAQGTRARRKDDSGRAPPETLKSRQP